MVLCISRFTDLKGSVLEEEETETSIHWFTPHIAVMARAGPDQSKELHLGLPNEWDDGLSARALFHGPKCISRGPEGKWSSWNCSMETSAPVQKASIVGGLGHGATGWSLLVYQICNI